MIPRLISSTYIGQHKEENTGKVFDVFRNIFDDDLVTYAMSCVSHDLETRILNECPEMTYPNIYAKMSMYEIKSQVDQDVVVAISVLERYANEELSTGIRDKFEESLEKAYRVFREYF